MNKGTFPSNKNNYIKLFSGNSKADQENNNNTIKGFSQQPEQNHRDSRYQQMSNFFQDNCILQQLKQQKRFHWTAQENQDYFSFCSKNFDLLKNSDKNQRKQKKVFKSMAKEIKTRTDKQCRSHHQKAFPLFCDQLKENTIHQQPTEGLDQEELNNESDGIESQSQSQQDDQNFSKQDMAKIFQNNFKIFFPVQPQFQLDQRIPPSQIISILQRMLKNMKPDSEFLENSMNVLFSCSEQISQFQQNQQSQFDIEEEIETPKAQILQHKNSNNNDRCEQINNPEEFTDILHLQDNCQNSTTSLNNQNEQKQMEHCSDLDERNVSSVKHSVPIKKGIKKSKSTSKKGH